MVIGAGIAGLAAAHYLRKAGRSVIVLEEARRVGGRMTTDHLDGLTLDRGAQFLSSGYALIRTLACEVGLQGDLRETSRHNAVVRAGIARVTRVDQPLDALTSGLLGFGPWMRFGLRTMALRRTLLSLPLDDYSRWADYDDETAAAWARGIHPALNEYLFEPMLAGFYFQSPEQTSRALALVLSAFGLRRGHTMTLARGLGSLPEALASRLDVRLKSAVATLDVRADRVVAHTGKGDVEASTAVLAVPAPEALRLLRGPDPVAAALLSTPYSACLNLAMVAEGGDWGPKHLRDVYGLLVPRIERDRVAAIGLERAKGRDPVAGGQVVNVMLSDEASRALMKRADEAVVETVLPEVERHLPGISARLVRTNVYRWPLAEPWSRPGRARQLRDYRALVARQRPRVLLAGDFMSMPFTEGAAESGRWAAEQLASAPGLFERPLAAVP